MRFSSSSALSDDRESRETASTASIQMTQVSCFLVKFIQIPPKRGCKTHGVQICWGSTWKRTSLVVFPRDRARIKAHWNTWRPACWKLPSTGLDRESSQYYTIFKAHTQIEGPSWHQNNHCLLLACSADAVETQDIWDTLAALSNHGSIFFRVSGRYVLSVWTFFGNLRYTSR